MCGRFTLTGNKEELIEEFDLQYFPENYVPSYNIAPSQQVLAAVEAVGGRRAGYLTWGLIPFWVKDIKKWKPFINARSETVAEKMSFKHLVNKRRCIIFADSFYEWKTVNQQKTPYRILTKNNKTFAMAGLWDRNEYNGREIVTCTILTTVANPVVKQIHDRMPVILENDEAVEIWLNTKEYSFETARQVMKPYPEQQLQVYPVSPIVNSPKNNTIDCIRPLTS